ncbi:uncharacterized protein LOC115875096 [Sitophilus oryzae]|uniref:Microtubule-associated protein Jupiter n=1 Tax=Sitophilus oryzae TaxID=7048 RepID=A0A6J2X5Q3_SITOR|nr:uncharacterized protein LOC115875096 [Sitophilus oryzae]
MTSTNIHIGINERKSSRVLRAPGGGHTDIFGTRDNGNEILTPNKRKNHPSSSIGSCFNMSEETKGTKTEQVTNGETDNPTESNQQPENQQLKVDETDENKAPIETKEKEQEQKEIEKAIPQTKRVRVPPGGFSSGFW